MLHIIRFLESETRTDRDKKIMRKRLLLETRSLMGTYFMLHNSNTDREIARAIGISVSRLKRMKRKGVWQDALGFWGATASRIPAEHRQDADLDGDFNLAEKVWAQMMSNQTPVLRDEDDTFEDRIGLEALSPLYEIKRHLTRAAHRAFYVLMKLPMFFIGGG